MSLMDALLLEEYFDRSQVWITQRADGMKGSASVNDPADGGVVPGVPLAGTSIAYNPLLVLVVCTNPHGYATSDSVAILGANAGGYPSRGPYFATFSITVVSTRAFTFVVSGTPDAPPYSMIQCFSQKGGGAKLDCLVFWPVAKALVTNHGFSNFDAISIQGNATTQFNGNFVALGVDDNGNTQFFYTLNSLPSGAVTTAGGTFTKLAFRFDSVMNATPTNSLVRLGNAPPSNPFKTRGVCSAYVIDPSVNPPAPDNWNYYAGFRVKNAQRFLGSGMEATTVRLAYAMDRVTQTSIFGRLSSPSGVSSVDITDMTLDADIAGQPNPPNSKGVASFAPVAPGGVALYGEHMRVRRVRVINFGTQCAPECFPLYLTGGIANETPPRLQVANNVIEDCVVEKPGENNFHEITAIYAHGSAGPSAQVYVAATGVGCVARRNYNNFRFASGGSSYYLKLVALDTRPPDLASGLFTFQVQPDAAVGLSRIAGNNAKLGGIYQNLTGALLAHPYYNGSFAITSVTELTPTTTPPTWVITCQMLDTPTKAQWDALGTLVISDPGHGINAYLGVDFHGPVAFAGTGGVVEGNAVYDCTNPGYNDTGCTRDIVFRGNYYSDVFNGLNQNFKPGVDDARDIVNTASGTPWVTWPVGGDNSLVEVATVVPHYLSPGAVVQIQNVVANSTINNLFNGFYYVTKITSSTAFQYTLRSIPAAGPDLPPYAPLRPVYQVYAQTPRAVIEANQIDLYKNSQFTYPNPQGCISVVGQTTLPVFGGWVVRDNAFRHTDSLPTNITNVGSLTPALRMLGLTNAIVESNLIDLESPTPLQFLNPQTAIETFNNTTMAGTSVFGADLSSTPNVVFNELIRSIDDVYCV